jgi:hypothetical protein
MAVPHAIGALKALRSNMMFSYTYIATFFGKKAIFCVWADGINGEGRCLGQSCCSLLPFVDRNPAPP